MLSDSVFCITTLMIGSWFKAKIAKRVASELLESFTVRPLLEQIKQHYSSLIELFLIECQEYARHQLIRVALIVVGLVFLSFAYLSFWITAIVLMTQWWGLLVAAGSCFLFHFLFGLIFIISSRLMKSKPFAPATREECRYDVTCARLSLSGKKN